jgi:hypothetical protein
MGEPPGRGLPPEAPHSGVQRCVPELEPAQRESPNSKRRDLGRGAALRGVSALALSLALVMTSAGARAGVASRWQGTVLCTTKIGSGYRSLAVDKKGRLAELTLRQAVPPGHRVELEGASTSKGGRALWARTVASVRVLGPTGKPFVVRTRLIENGYARYGFYRNGHPWGCPVAFDDAAAVSVAKLILSGRSAEVRLTLHNGRLVHLGPREAPLRALAHAAKARADLEHFLTLLAHGNSIAACATLARDALLIHGGRDGCVIAFESAKFLYRDRYARASVQQVALFNLDGNSYALAAINRSQGYARAFLIREGGTYHYLGDLELSPIELW